MNWITYYLISSFVAPALYVAIITDPSDSKTHVKIDERGDGFAYMLLCLVWPIAFLILGWDKIDRGRKALIRDAAQEIVSEHDLEDGHIYKGLNVFVSFAEKDLKTLIKAYRLGVLDLEVNRIEAIREELLRRNMERNLLK
jgi:hypothetical protein